MGQLHVYNLCITKVSEGEESEQGREKLFEEIMAECIPKVVKKQVMEVQKERVLIKVNPKRPSQDTSYLKR